MRMLGIVLAVFAVCALPVMAEAAGVNTQRLCQDQDLTGTFKLIDLTEIPKGEESTWFSQYRHHYLVFYPTRTYAYIASQRKMANPEDLQKTITYTMAQANTPVERKYTLDNTGLLTLYVGERVDYTYRCVMIIRAGGKEEVGDLVFTGYSRHNTELYKLFRHWP